MQARHKAQILLRRAKGLENVVSPSKQSVRKKLQTTVEKLVKIIQSMEKRRGEMEAEIIREGCPALSSLGERLGG